MSLEAANAALRPYYGAPRWNPHPSPRRLTAPEVLEMARRLGPLPYSERGRNPGPALPAPSVLVGWQVDADRRLVGRARAPRSRSPWSRWEPATAPGRQAFLAAGPACLTALRYVLVETTRPAASSSGPTSPSSPRSWCWAGRAGRPGGDDDDPDGWDTRADPGDGRHRSVGHLAARAARGGRTRPVVVAIGWASRLPSDRLEWRDGRWWEIRLAADQHGAVCRSCRSRWTGLAPPPAERLAGCRRPTSASSRRGAATPCSGRAVDWLAGTLRVAGSGRLVVIDRWTDVTRPLTPGEAPPLALDQLAAVRRPIDAAPVESFPGTSPMAVSWRLG